MKIFSSLLLLSCFFFHQSSATIYYVTNNHVSGSGSVGDAITLANAHIGKDSIYFNISSSTVAGRTIKITSDSLLPNIKDTTIIDATTQPYGSHFGNSTAKIQLTSPDTAAVGLVIDVTAQNSEVYGFFISHFATGIKLLGDGFIVGSINNGNVVAYCTDVCMKVSNVTEGSIVATFVGVDTSGANITSPFATGILLDNSKKITLGGKQQNSRNVISGCFVGLKISDSKYITIQGNYIGTDVYSTIAIPNTTGILATQSSDGNTKNITIGGDSEKYVNVISGNLQRGLDLNFSNATIEGNLIGTDITGTLHLGNGSYGIYFRGGLDHPSHDNTVGGINGGAGNVIAYNGQEGIYLEDAGAHNIAMRGNRMFCNSQISGGGGIVVNGGNQGVVPPEIVIVSNNFISGTTYPSAIIDVYSADSCNKCEGADYLGTIQADSNGVFSDTILINGSVTVTANDTFGNTSAFASCKDTSNTSCIFAAFFKSKNKVCTNELLYLSDQTISVPGSAITSWEWEFGDGQSSSVQNPVVSFLLGGTFAITLIVSNTDGCSDTTTDSITVKDGVVANFTSDTDVCLGTPVHFSDLSYALGSSFILSWYWDLGDDSVSTYTDFLHTYPQAGSYSVTLSIVNNNNCISTFTDTVNVHAFPTADFVVSPTACAVSPIQFYDSSSTAPGSTLTSWMWNFGDGDTSTVENATHLFTASGSYLITLVATDNFGCSDTTIQGITILAGAIANFNYTSNGLTVSFINTSTFNAEYSMQWTFGDGNTSSLQTPTHNYNSFGAYEVCLIVHDYTCNMSDTLCQTIVITGVNEVTENSGIILSPNPASDAVTVSNPSSYSIDKIMLFNSLGEEIILREPVKTSSQKITLQLPKLPQGIYWLQITTTQGASMKKLVIAQN